MVNIPVFSKFRPLTLEKGFSLSLPADFSQYQAE
jgi:hypothetical protein